MFSVKSPFAAVDFSVKFNPKKDMLDSKEIF
jgi:hypothetical protein